MCTIRKGTETYKEKKLTCTQINESWSGNICFLSNTQIHKPKQHSIDNTYTK